MQRDSFVRRFTTVAGLWLSVTAAVVSAHPGGLDDNGGHVNRSTGEYHCHTVECQETGHEGSENTHLRVVSFNIQFLGNFKQRDDTALAGLLAPYDIVVVQELVAPPFGGTFPDNTSYRPDPEARHFFEAMMAAGFEYRLSEEDTGTNDQNHLNSTATEWWVTFYKPDLIEPAQGIPSGFLAADRTNNDDYERVPYAMAFRTLNRGNDFVLISVHLQPGDRNADQEKRKHELASVANWIAANDDTEKDFFILGDMNFENCDEIALDLPSGYQALNSGLDCTSTNTNVNGPRPYDNVLLPQAANSELANGGNFEVINIIEAMRVPWYEDFTTPYPGDSPYDHNTFRQRYSDHHPVVFQIRIGGDDD